MLPAGFEHADSRRGADGDAEEPAFHGIALANRSRLPCEHQEGGLERILGCVPIPERLVAHAQNHRPVAFDENLECGIATFASTV